MLTNPKAHSNHMHEKVVMARATENVRRSAKWIEDTMSFNISPQQFQYQGSPDQRINKVRHDVMSLSSMERTQFSMYDREFAWDEKGEEISFEEVRAMRYHGYKSPFFTYPGKDIFVKPVVVEAEKENKQPQVNAQPVIVKPVEPSKKEIQPQVAPVKENVLVEVNQVSVEAKPAQLKVKQNSRVRFSDVFEQKQEKRTEVRRSILRPPPVLSEEYKNEDAFDQAVNSVHNMHKEISFTPFNPPSILRDNTNKTRTLGLTQTKTNVKKIQFTENVKTAETPKSSKKYKVTQDYHPNKLNIMTEEKKETQPVIVNKKNTQPKKAVFAKPAPIAKPVATQTPKDDTFTSSSFNALISEFDSNMTSEFTSSNMTLNSLEALAAFQKMANKPVSSDNEDSCEGEVTSNIATGDFLSLFQSASNSAIPEQQDETLSWMKENKKNNDNLSNTATIATGDFLHLFQTIEKNNDNNDTAISPDLNNNFDMDHNENLNNTTNFATGDFLHLFQKVENNNPVTPNKNENTTTNFATGDFLHLFQKVENNNNPVTPNNKNNYNNNNNDNTFATGDFLTLFQASQNPQLDQVCSMNESKSEKIKLTFKESGMNVDWNQEERNSNVVNDNNTTSIVTGDFLNLFQSFGQSKEQAIPEDQTLGGDEYEDASSMKTEDIIRNYPYRGGISEITGVVTAELSSIFGINNLGEEEGLADEDIDEQYLNALNDSLEKTDNEQAFSEYKGNMDTIKEALPIFVFPDSENEKLIDPYHFIQDARMELVDHLLTTYDGSVIDYSDESAPRIQLNEYLTLGTFSFLVKQQLGECSYLLEASNMLYRLSLQSPPAPWEYYVCKQLQERISDPVTRSSFLPAKPYELMYIASDKSLIVEGWDQKILTMQDVIDSSKKGAPLQPEMMAYFILGIIQLIQVAHKYKFVLGSSQFDQFIVSEEMKLEAPLKLCGFSKSLDLLSFPQQAFFLSTQAPLQPNPNQPWKQDIDLIGLAEIAHQLIFDKPLEIKCDNNVWSSPNTLKGFREDKALYELLFKLCLNEPRDTEKVLDTLQSEFKKFFSARRVIALKNQFKKIVS